jgi:hypothetical protein
MDFYKRRGKGQVFKTEADIEDVIAFLGTLTDCRYSKVCDRRR